MDRPFFVFFFDFTFVKSRSVILSSIFSRVREMFADVRLPMCQFFNWNIDGIGSFLVPEHYVVKNVLGSGSFGSVISAQCIIGENRGSLVAIKQIKNIYSEENNAVRVKREVQFMAHLDHPNVLGLQDVYFRYDEKQQIKEAYIIMFAMPTDLHRIIRSKNRLTAEHIKFISYQLFCGLDHIHKSDIIHRDIKPSNILIDSYCHVKIADFGLSRCASSQKSTNDNKFTEYTVTRWYRAPEILCDLTYDKKIDIWSVGCIIGEMLLRDVVFPGSDYLEQLEFIIEILGTPSTETINGLGNILAIDFIKSLKKVSAKPFSTIFPTADALAIDLLENIITFRPENRFTAAEALQHPYFDDVRSEEITNIPFRHFDGARANKQDLINCATMLPTPQ